jgi:hypothetical protein
VALSLKSNRLKVFACKEVSTMRKPRDRHDNASYSLSEVSMNRLEKMIKVELQALRKLSKYQTIVSFTGDASIDTETYIIRIYLEYYPGGSLKDFLKLRVDSR